MYDSSVRYATLMPLSSVIKTAETVTLQIPNGPETVGLVIPIDRPIIKALMYRQSKQSSFGKNLSSERD